MYSRSQPEVSNQRLSVRPPPLIFDTDTLQNRIRTLFWLSVSNFVLPVPMLTAQLVLLAVHHGAETFSYTILNILVGFVCAICAVFATGTYLASRESFEGLSS
jgi:hypothetical protein